jgi:hypothetical protein
VHPQSPRLNAASAITHLPITYLLAAVSRFSSAVGLHVGDDAQRGLVPPLIEKAREFVQCLLAL